jgi:hypothetical protein
VCTLRLVLYDNQNRENLATLIAIKFMGGGPDGETDDGEVIRC